MNNRTLNDSAYAELVSLYQGKEINRVLEKVELYLEDRILDPRLLTLKGICEQQRGNLKGAAEAFSQAINLSPDHTDALINLGLVKKILGDTKVQSRCTNGRSHLTHKKLMHSIILVIFICISTIRKLA